MPSEHPATMSEPSTVASPTSTSTAAPKPLLRGWQHLVAFCAVLVLGPLLISQAPTTGTTIALTIYVISIAALFGVSAAFHLKTWSPPARRRMRRADHATIFVAIAGTYTAVAGLALQGWARALTLCLVWVGAVAGIVLRQVWLEAPKWAVAVPYVVVGWSALAVLPQLARSLGGVGFTLLLLGGVLYTAGAIVYALRRPNPAPAVFGYHEVFHSCTVAGAALHFIAIAFFALPKA